MKKVSTWGMLMFLAAGLTLGATSCSDDDENLENVTPPEITVQKGSVQGTVSSLSGAVAGATVKMGNLSATTDASGAFTFADVAAGSYTLSVAVDGYETPADQTVNVKDGVASVANFVMAKIATTKVTVDVNATEEVKTEPIQAEVPAVAKEATIEYQATVPVGALEAPESGEEVVLEISTMSSTSAASRATNAVLGGVSVKTNAKFNKPVLVDVAVSSADVASEAIVNKSNNGQTSKGNFQVNGKIITISVDSNGDYSIVLPAVSITKSTNVTYVEVLNFDKDNTYGNAAAAVSDPTYTYNVGGSTSVTGNNAYLIAYLAASSINSQSSVTGSYNLGFTSVPVGTGVSILGKQSKTETSTKATLGSLSAEVKTVMWGGVTFTTSSYNRQHTGGGSK